MNRTFFHRAALFALLTALSPLLIVGCASQPDPRERTDPGATDFVVERLQIQGVEAVSERELRNGLATRESPRIRTKFGRLPLIGAEPRYFNRFAWMQDRERIISFYQQHGYFNVAFDDISITEDPDRKTVRISLTIDEGEPTRVSQINLRGLIPGETPPADELLADLPLDEGDIFVQQHYQRSRNTIANRLRDAGFAYASVSGRVFVDPDGHTADISFFVEPGPLARFGPVYVFGNDEISEASIRRALRFEEGDPYSPQALQQAQEDVFGLGVFGMVTVLPAHEARDAAVETRRDQRRMEEILDEYDLPGDDTDSDRPDPGVQTPRGGDEPAQSISEILAGAQHEAEVRGRLDPEVPIIIRVQEATGYNLRVGTGVAVESTRQDVRGLVNWSSRNFAAGLPGELRRIDHNTAVGYAWAPGLIGPGDVRNRGVILSSQLEFQQPQLLREPHTRLRIRAGVDRDVTEGFTVWNPSLRLSVDRSLWNYFVVGMSYNIAFFRYSDVAEGLDATGTELGLDFRDRFLLEILEPSVAFDTRDDILDPSRGTRIELSLQQAGRYVFGGEFDFLRPVLSAEQYYGIRHGMVLALRSRLGAVYDVRRETGIPIQSRLYSGGTGSMRSFGRDRLSPFTADDDPVPIGGLTQFEASVEPRFRLARDFLDIGDVWGAIFLDSATVLGSQFLFDTAPNEHGTVGPGDLQSTLLYGAGIGAWWNTPVGPVRLDVARNLSDLSDDPRFERDAVQNLLQRYNFYLSIGHSF